MRTSGVLLVTVGLMWSVLARPNEAGMEPEPFFEKPSSRIISGQVSTYGKYPYLCSLRWFGDHVCGSIIYNAKTLITAAHCVYHRYNELSVICGEFDRNQTDAFEQPRRVILRLIHEDYLRDPDKLFPNDIALLELESSLQFTTHVRAATFPDSSTELATSCQIMGWGRFGDSLEGSTVLQELTIRRLDDEECRQRFGPYLKRSHICFMNKQKLETACHGDSGGPAKCGEYVVGVASFVSHDGSDKQRCRAYYPNVYSRLSHYSDWIKSHAFQ